MGLGRWIKHGLLPHTIYTDAVKNMIDEGGVVEGVKKSIDQEIKEDNPLTSMIYETGKVDGKVEGYKEASFEYEKKLREQAELFLKQKKSFESCRDEYERLLDEYEEAIEELKSKLNKTENENKLLKQMIKYQKELRQLAG